jgi:hypothetical protein
MTTRFSLTGVALAALTLASCATAPTALPPWAASPAAIRTVFPDSEYIAQRGRGRTRQTAEVAAAAEIARFMTSQVAATTGYTMSTRQTNGQSAELLETLDEAYVKTQMDLFGIRYADDAFYDKAQKEWQSVAYIDRAEAWQVYEPRFKRQADSFQHLFDAAEAESESVKKVFRYLAAQQYARTPEFENAALFGQLLSPARMNAEFGLVRESQAGIPQKLDNAKRNAGIYIDCPADFEALVYTAFSECFAAQGFPVTRTRSAAAATCTVTVTDGEQRRDSGVYYYPAVQAALTGKSGPLWTFNAQADKSAAVTPDVAKRRAYTALAAQVRVTFAAQWTANNF